MDRATRTTKNEEKKSVIPELNCSTFSIMLRCNRKIVGSIRYQVCVRQNNDK